ncbi:unnamed protein product [Eruca vesicaria subsp. sativa]|uniref:Uncharacterized protein n=1 Tax=Eruca vesicaria subsp. sativa TaxID=29727 RepID=A0ABC8JB45_ERUVS|nr:unnamed protein product [Eruca vesicaria subsp. sativa]
MERKSDDLESYSKTKIQEMEKELDQMRVIIKELEKDHLMSQIENGCSLDDLSQTEKELDRKVNKELEMSQLMSQLENGRRLDDLSQTEKDALKSYASEKITSLERLLGKQQQHPSTSAINEPILVDDDDDDIPKAAHDDVAPVGGPSLNPMGRGSDYFMENWFFDTPKLLKHGDETTNLTTVASRFDLNMVPSDGEVLKHGGETNLTTVASRFDLNMVPSDEIMKTYEGQSSKSGGADEA